MDRGLVTAWIPISTPLNTHRYLVAASLIGGSLRGVRNLDQCPHLHHWTTINKVAQVPATPPGWPRLPRHPSGGKGDKELAWRHRGNGTSSGAQAGRPRLPGVGSHGRRLRSRTSPPSGLDSGYHAGTGPRQESRGRKRRGGERERRTVGFRQPRSSLEAAQWIVPAPPGRWSARRCLPRSTAICGRRPGAGEPSRRAGRSPPAAAIRSAGGAARGSGRPAGGWLASGRCRPGGSELAAAAPPTVPPRLAEGWGALASPSGATHMPLWFSRKDRGMPPGRPAAPSSVPACGWAEPGLLDSPWPEPPGPSSSGTARGPPAGSGRGHRIAFPGPPSCPAALYGVPGGVPRVTGWHPQMANPSVRTWWQRRSGFLPGFRHQCNKVRKKEGSRQGWLVKTRVIYCKQINLNRCALCASSVHQLSRLSQGSLSVFVLAVSLSQTMRPSLHSISLLESPLALFGLSTPITAISQVFLILHLTHLPLSPESFSRCRLHWTTPPSPQRFFSNPVFPSFQG